MARQSTGGQPSVLYPAYPAFFTQMGGLPGMPKTNALFQIYRQMLKASSTYVLVLNILITPVHAVEGQIVYYLSLSDVGYATKVINSLNGKSCKKGCYHILTIAFIFPRTETSHIPKEICL